MKHAVTCLKWKWRRQAGFIEGQLREGIPYSERAAGEAQGYSRALRACAAAVERAVDRAARRGAGFRTSTPSRKGAA